MGVFRGIRPVHVRSYIREFEHVDASVVANDRYTVKIANISVDEEARLLYNSKPISTIKDVMFVFPEFMTGYGYPSSAFLSAGRDLRVQPAIWSLLSDTERKEIVANINESSPVLEFKAYRELTKG